MELFQEGESKRLASIQFFETNMRENLSLDVIELIEKEMDFDDIVSLLFLVSEEKHAKYIFQRITQFLNINSTTNGKCEDINYSLLTDWCLSNPNSWHFKIIEALAIIECFNILSKIGYKKNDIKEHFQSNNSEFSLYVSVLKKKLYLEFSNTAAQKTQSLYECLRKAENCSINFPHYNLITNKNCFEFLFIYLSSESIITLEEDSPKLEFLIDSLNKASLFDLKQTLENYLSKYFTKNFTCGYSDDISSRRNKVSIVSHASDTVNTSEFCKEDKGDSEDFIAEVNENGEFYEDVGLSYYEIKDSGNLGLCMIINQKNFIKYREKEPKLQTLVSKDILFDRHGTERDVERLEETFNNFKVSVIVENDVLHSSIEDCIRTTINNEFKQHHSVFFLVILSHGHQGVVYGVNSIPITISSIVDVVLESYMKLKNIPKVIILQACQGNSPNPVLETDGSSGKEGFPQPKSSGLNCESRESHNQKVRTAYHDDLLMCFSTVGGYESYRHTKEGSKYIQILCSNLTKYGYSDDFLSICTRVNNDLKKLYVPIAIEPNLMIPSTQVSETSSCLHKKLFLVKPSTAKSQRRQRKQVESSNLIS